MVATAAGRVDKVIRIVATSGDSFEDAAQRAVAEATKTIHNLQAAKVIRSDIVIDDGKVGRYRVAMEAAFQLDRQRVSVGDLTPLRVHRSLIVANQTLASPGLEQIVSERMAQGPVEFHILVPEASNAGAFTDPAAVVDPVLMENAARARLLALKEADDRLAEFKLTFAHLGDALTAEVGLGDPVMATRRVMERSSFDEIIISTLPPGISRWLKLDLPHRMERAFGLPVTTLVQPS